LGAVPPARVALPASVGEAVPACLKGPTLRLRRHLQSGGCAGVRRVRPPLSHGMVPPCRAEGPASSRGCDRGLRAGPAGKGSHKSGSAVVLVDQASEDVDSFDSPTGLASLTPCRRAYFSTSTAAPERIHSGPTHGAATVASGGVPLHVPNRTSGLLLRRSYGQCAPCSCGGPRRTKVVGEYIA
jgi:hypothetical protein